MKRDLAALGSRRFDLLVIGGGMFGAAAALDAARRGLAVALIDRGDWCGATSAHSFKMIHGGIRYLQHLDVKRIRQSSDARSGFLRVAPHLVQPLPIVVPTYGHLGMRSKPVLRAGMALYDALTMGRNRGIADPARHIPRASFLDAAEVRTRYPGLETRGLTGAGVFADGQMYNPTRLVLSFVRSAAGEGAAVANYLEADGLLREGDRIVGATAADRLGGERIEIRAKMVLNAAGPYAQRLLEGALGRSLEPATPFSRDAYFIVPRPLIEGNAALTVPASDHIDEDARLSRGGRHLFLVPWRGVTLVGVWHKVWPGHPDSYEITDAELERWIAEVNRGYPGLGLTLDDVAMGSAGLVPFGEADPNATQLKFAHRSRIVDHKAERGLDGLLTLIGVRYTTGPYDAAGVIDGVMRRLGCARAPSTLAEQPVHGGDFDSFEALVTEIEREQVAPDAARALAHNHGSAFRAVLAGRQGEARTLPGSTVLEAEIGHAIREEMACCLADVVFRRTDLATSGTMSDEALERAADLAAAAAGWTAARRDAEVAFVRERMGKARGGRAMLADSLPAGAGRAAA